MANNKNFKVTNAANPGTYLLGTGTPTFTTSVNTSGISSKGLHGFPSTTSSHYGDRKYFHPAGTYVYWLDSSQDYLYQAQVASDLEPYYGRGYFKDGVAFKQIVVTSAAPAGFWFKSNGLSLYVQNRGIVYVSSLSTAWDLSTAGNFATSTSFTAYWGTFPYGFQFNSDGTHIYAAPSNTNTIVDITLTGAWVLSYSSHTTYTFSEFQYVRGLSFSDDGSVLYIVASTPNNSYKVVRYALSTPWNIGTRGTAVYTVDYPNGVAQHSVTFRDDADGKLIIGNNVYSTNKDTISFDPYQAAYFDASQYAPASLTTEVTCTSQFPTPHSGALLALANTPGVSGEVYPYELTDFSFTPLSGTTGFLSSLANAYFYTVSEDGYYAIAVNNGDFYSSTTAMTTPFDLRTLNGASTRYYDASAVTGDTAASVRIAISPDGTKLLSYTRQTNSIYLFTLSTPWDVSTASATTFVTYFTLNSLSGGLYSTNATPAYIRWGNNGSSIILSTTNNDMFKFTVTTPYTLSGLAYSQYNQYSNTQLDPTGHFGFVTTAGVTTQAVTPTVYFPTAWDISDSGNVNNNFVYKKAVDAPAITVGSLGFISSIPPGYVASPEHFLLGPYQGFAMIRTGNRPSIAWNSARFLWDAAPSVVNTSNGRNNIYAVMPAQLNVRSYGNLFFEG